MIEKINGQCYRNMIEYGVRNLNMHCKAVNKLNVFPVPDGDTGTNMVTTIKNGLVSANESTSTLSEFAKAFSAAVVFGARGNSGVIVSQFFKGISELFYNVEDADAELFVKALEKGVECARSSVANPVEGTILTVIRDATNAVKAANPCEKSIDEIIELFIETAKISLEGTPELLPTLKEAGVVDSGGAGVVYIFEGMKKYLDGEEIDFIENEESTSVADYTAFSRNSRFDYGYCTELLIQLLNGKAEFDCDLLRSRLEQLGDSMVLSCADDKLKLHIHTHTPEKILELCHQYGEFLSLKIENMTVQHTETISNILYSSEKNEGAFAVVAVAYDRDICRMFLDMGADAVIFSDESVSAKEYIEAFKGLECGEIIVFPNSPDSTLAAIQAKNIYKDAKVTVVNSRSVAECYASLPIIDFSQKDIHKVVDAVTETVNKLYVVSVARRSEPLIYDPKAGKSNEYYAISGKEVLSVNISLRDTVMNTIKKVLKTQSKEIITVFYGKETSELQLEEILSEISELNVSMEIYTIPVANLPCIMSISFE